MHILMRLNLESHLLVDKAEFCDKMPSGPCSLRSYPLQVLWLPEMPHCPPCNLCSIQWLPFSSQTENPPILTPHPLGPCPFQVLAQLLLILYISSQILLDFIYLFSEKGTGREKERERNINVWLPLVHLQLRTCPAAQACALTGNRTGDPLVLRLVLNPLSYTSWGQV